MQQEKSDRVGPGRRDGDGKRVWMGQRSDDEYVWRTVCVGGPWQSVFQERIALPGSKELMRNKARQMHRAGRLRSSSRAPVYPTAGGFTAEASFQVRRGEAPKTAICLHERVRGAPGQFPRRARWYGLEREIGSKKALTLTGSP